MSRSLFSLVAAAVTLGGWIASVWGARVIRRLAPSSTRIVATGLLLSYGLALWLRPSAWPVIDLAVLLGAIGGILLLEAALRTPGAVAAFLAVAAIVDVFSMSGGLSRVLLDRYREGASDLLLYLTLVVPMRGRAVPIVGIGDLLVGGAAATALLRLGYRPLAVMGAISVGLLCALAYGLWRGGAPAIPFVAAAVFVLLRRRPVAIGPRRHGPPWMGRSGSGA